MITIFLGRYFLKLKTIIDYFRVLTGCMRQPIKPCSLKVYIGNRDDLNKKNSKVISSRLGGTNELYNI